MISSAASFGMLIIFGRYAYAAGLRLRDAPNTASNTLKILPVGTTLTVLKPGAGKIGVNGQWLKVKEPGGLTGYIAAWYVQ